MSLLHDDNGPLEGILQDLIEGLLNDLVEWIMSFITGLLPGAE